MANQRNGISEMTPRCWYFGWRRSFGHRLADWKHHVVRVCPAGPWISFDAKYTPQPKDALGVWRRTVVHGCTIIACWDRSGDKRGNSNSAFIVEGEHSLSKAFDIAMATFPEIVARIIPQFGTDWLREENRAEVR